jgi:hypothetical protein
MNCLRCQGLMTIVRLEDAGSSTSCEAFSGWRCLLCGEVLEPGITANRKVCRQPKRNLARPPGTLLPGARGLKRNKPWM